MNKFEIGSQKIKFHENAGGDFEFELAWDDGSEFLLKGDFLFDDELEKVAASESYVYV